MTNKAGSPLTGDTTGSVLLASSSTAAILDAAADLFLAAGYDGASLEQVGRSAGLSRQTVYNLFGSKEVLFRRVVDRHWAAIRAEVATAFAARTTRLEGSSAEILRGFAYALLRFVKDTDQVAFTRLVVAESRRLPWIAEEFYRAGKEPIVRSFAEALAQMTEAGLLRCEHPDIASRQFMGIVQEFIIWPHVMAIGPAVHELPADEVAIEEAVSMFLSRYGV